MRSGEREERLMTSFFPLLQILDRIDFQRKTNKSVFGGKSQNFLNLARTSRIKRARARNMKEYTFL